MRYVASSKDFAPLNVHIFTMFNWVIDQNRSIVNAGWQSTMLTIGAMTALGAIFLRHSMATMMVLLSTCSITVCFGGLLFAWNVPLDATVVVCLIMGVGLGCSAPVPRNARRPGCPPLG